MQHRLLLATLLATLLVSLSACGSSTTTTVSSVTSSGSTLVAIPQTPAGYTTVDVTLSDYKIVASMTTFTAGKPYFFIITNSGKANHEFMIMPPMMGGHINSLAKMSFAAIENIEPGTTQTLKFTFIPDKSVPVQQLEISCHYSDHYARGMRLPITVKQ
jgi:uncharacterized cupredoxin-like copper-binding protein